VLELAVALPQVEEQAGQRIEQVGMLDVAQRVLVVLQVVLSRGAAGELLRLERGLGRHLVRYFLRRRRERQGEQGGGQHARILQQFPLKE
jgi:hypothetical protein